jgi:RNA polymerase sigma factor (sigma-70 family)
MVASLAAKYQIISQWYKLHTAWLRGWLYQRSGCRALAEDLSHDTYLRLLQRGGTGASSEVENPKAYLKTIAHGLLVDSFRKQSLETAYLESLSISDVSNDAPDLDLELLQTLKTIDQALAGLAFEQRQAFVLYQFRQMPYAQIAEDLAISERTAKRYVKAAMSHLLYQHMLDGLQ